MMTYNCERYTLLQEESSHFSASDKHCSSYVPFFLKRLNADIYTDDEITV